MIYPLWPLIFFAIVIKTVNAQLMHPEVLFSKYMQSETMNTPWAGHSWPSESGGIDNKNINSQLRNSPVDKLDKLFHSNGIFKQWEHDRHNKNLIDHSSGQALAASKETEPLHSRHIGLYTFGRKDHLKLSMADQKAYLAEKWLDQDIVVIDQQNLTARSFFQIIVKEIGILKRPLVFEMSQKNHVAFAYQIEDIKESDFLAVRQNDSAHLLYPVRFNMNIFFVRSDAYPSAETSVFNMKGTPFAKDMTENDHFFKERISFVLFFDEPHVFQKFAQIRGNLIGEGYLFDNNQYKNWKIKQVHSLGHLWPTFSLRSLPIDWQQVEENFYYLSKMATKKTDLKRLEFTLLYSKRWIELFDHLSEENIKNFLIERVRIAMKLNAMEGQASTKDIEIKDDRAIMTLELLEQHQKEKILRAFHDSQMKILL